MSLEEAEGEKEMLERLPTASPAANPIPNPPSMAQVNKLSKKTNGLLYFIQIVPLWDNSAQLVWCRHDGNGASGDPLGG